MEPFWVVAHYVTGSDAFPTSWLDSGYFYLVDLKYTVGGQVPVTIMPTNSGNFVNGVWSGSITAQQRATNVTLLADDGQGHAGTSNPFDVVPASGVIDHFVWSAIPSPRTNGVPFGVTISAQDFYNTTASNFTGTASLLAMSAPPVAGCRGAVLCLTLLTIIHRLPGRRGRSPKRVSHRCR